MKLYILAELEVDDKSMWGRDEEEHQTFLDMLLRKPPFDDDLVLHSNFLGDTVGTLNKVLGVSDELKALANLAYKKVVSDDFSG